MVGTALWFFLVVYLVIFTFTGGPVGVCAIIAGGFVLYLAACTLEGGGLVALLVVFALMGGSRGPGTARR